MVWDKVQRAKKTIPALGISGNRRYLRIAGLPTDAASADIYSAGDGLYRICVPGGNKLWKDPSEGVKVMTNVLDRVFSWVSMEEVRDGCWEFEC